MKKSFLTIMLICTLQSFSQKAEFTAKNLSDVVQITKFKGVGILKGYTSQKINQFFNAVEANQPAIQQLNINAWFYCEYKKIDNLETYNHYYPDISRYTYDMYCREINAIMLIDGVIQQPK